ncbi:ankyrin repeat-containing domain protein [Aspergillus oleicola]
MRLCLFLIDHGAAVGTPASKMWGTPLQEAIEKANLNLINTLVEHRVDINALSAKDCRVTALQAAFIKGIFKLAVRLLERGADVSVPAAPQDSRIAIDGAAERGRFDMVKLLLNAYACQGFADADLEPVRRQAAGYAEKEGYFQIARWLCGD